MSMFYDNYVRLCAQKGKSLSHVAEAVGLSRTSPNGWKNGKYPSEVNLQKLADYFGVTVAYLKGEEDTITVDGISITPEERKLLELIKMLTEDEVKQASDYLGYIISKRGK